MLVDMIGGMDFAKEFRDGKTVVGDKCSLRAGRVLAYYGIFHFLFRFIF